MQSYNFDKIREIPNNISGVYSIVNSLNNNRYIGSSKDIRSRIYQHHYNLEKNKHHSIHLQNAYNKYGRDKFVIVILEVCEPIRDTLLYIEQKYLDLNPEYNIAKLASCPAQLVQSNETKQKRANKLKGQKRSDEFKKRHSEILLGKTGKPVYQYTLDGDYIQTFVNTTQASRYFGDNRTRGVTIQECCKGKGKQSYGYQWRWHTENHKNIGKYISHSMDVIEKSKRKICKFSLDGQLLNIYNSISDAARELHTKNIIATCSNIVQCAKGKKNQAYKFKWKYYNDK